MLARLYLQDASGLSHYRLVHETGQSAIVSVAQEGPQGYETTSFVNQRLSSEVFATVQQRPDLAFYDVKQPATVKTFERVPGATLTGEVNTTNATTVFATVRLQTNRGRNFTYVQTVETDGQGYFEMTVPYATTNTVGPADSGTDSGVEALGEYQLFAGNPFAPTARGTAAVPEPAIYDGETVTVEFESVERSTGNETNSSNSSALRFPASGLSTSEELGTAGWQDIIGSGSAVVVEPRIAADG
jgi:dolichyl-diphosphooligosaccharide--protein glycosyltransferase